MHSTPQHHKALEHLPTFIQPAGLLVLMSSDGFGCTPVVLLSVRIASSSNRGAAEAPTSKSRLAAATRYNALIGTARLPAHLNSDG